MDVKEAAKIIMDYAARAKGIAWASAPIAYTSSRACQLALCDLMDKLQAATCDKERQQLQEQIAEQQKPWQELTRLTDHLDVTAATCRRILKGEL